MRLALLALVLAFGCSKKADQAKPPPAPLAPAEIQRAQDACSAYVARVCACSSPAGQKQCPLAKPLPEAVKIALDIAMDPKSLPDDARRAQVNVRETVKECIEETAKLPAIGCP